MKKFILIVSVLAMVLSMAACGANAPAPTTAPTQSASQSQEESTFTGTLEEKKDFMITVTGEDGTPYLFNLEGVVCPAEVGQTVTVTYTGDITDFDAQLMAVKIEKN